jgi:hypothetical protein
MCKREWKDGRLVEANQNECMKRVFAIQFVARCEGAQQRGDSDDGDEVGREKEKRQRWRDERWQTSG